MEGTNWGTARDAYSADTVAAMSRALQMDALKRADSSSASFYGSQYSGYTNIAAAVHPVHESPLAVDQVRPQ